MRALTSLFVAGTLTLGLAGTAFAKKNAHGAPPIKAGASLGYFLWHDGNGWHLRASASDKQHTFHGVIRQKNVHDLKATRPTLSSKIQGEPNAIRFEFDVYKGGVEGFDWQGDDPCVTPELKFDRQARPDLVHVGEKQETPSAMPFDACDVVS